MVVRTVSHNENVNKYFFFVTGVEWEQYLNVLNCVHFRVAIIFK